jgi:hypothetical protein
MTICHYWLSRTQVSTLKLTLIGPGSRRTSYCSTLDKFAIIEGAQIASKISPKFLALELG